MIAFPEIDPVAVHLGPLAIRWYGLSWVTGILLAWWLLDRRSRRPGSAWDGEAVSDLIFYAALGMILGGRLGYALFYNPGSYLADPLAVVRVWEGGMSFNGGLIGALTGCWLWGRRSGRGFLACSDLLAPVVPVGLFFGRIANFINGELWGAPTALPWGVIFPDPRAGHIPRHPSQLYEAALEGAVLFAVLWMLSSQPQPRGRMTGLFLAGYGLFRFAVEFVRQPDGQLGYIAFGWLTMGQALSLPMILVGLWLLRREDRA